MRVFRTEDFKWVLERDNGETIELSRSESNLLYHEMLKESVWSEVELRFPASDEQFMGQFGYSREEIEVAKEAIVEELLPELQDISEDLVYSTVTRHCKHLS